MTRASLLLVVLPLIASCKRPDPPRRDAGVPIPPAIREIRDHNPDAAHPVLVPPVAVDSGLPAIPVADVITFDNGQAPEQTFEGPGVRVVVGVDGMVTVRATDLWDGGFEQPYESCVFVRNALVQLRRSLPPASVEVVVRACGDARPGERVPVLRPAPRPAPARR